MYELNGIVYAGNPTPMKKVIYAEYRGNYMIRVAFNTGEVVDVNFTHGFDGSAFEPLKNESVLKDFAIQHGVLTWRNGDIDVAPEYLLEIGTVIEHAVMA